MNISGLPGAPSGLGSAGTQIGLSERGAQGGHDAFGALLGSLAGSQQAADGARADIAVGADRDLHDAVLAVEMESLAFDLAVQIRNRLVDAYQEVFRMSV
jgi:flagellar hook-basal body complex protein FliE